MIFKNFPSFYYRINTSLLPPEFEQLQKVRNDLVTELNKLDIKLN